MIVKRINQNQKHKRIPTIIKPTKNQRMKASLPIILTGKMMMIKLMIKNSLNKLSKAHQADSVAHQLRRCKIKSRILMKAIGTMIKRKRKSPLVEMDEIKMWPKMMIKMNFSPIM